MFHPDLQAQVPAEAPKKRRNREHTNSKHGCSQCKARKVKCDESKPKCKNCSRRGTLCHYPYDVPSNSNGLDELARLAASSPAYNGSQSLSLHGVGPYYNSNGRPDYHAQGGYAPGRMSPSTSYHHTNHAADPLDVNVTHLELLHNFTYSTAPAIAASSDAERLWAHVIMKLAFSNRFLLHSILAVSALHHGYFHSDQRGEYNNLAAAHEDRAVNLAQAAVSQPSVENAELIFAFVLTRIYYAFAAPDLSALDPGTNSDRQRPLQSAVQTINILRETRNIFPLVKDWIEQGSLAPLLDMPYGHTRPSDQLEEGDKEDHWARLLVFASSSSSAGPQQVEDLEVYAAAASSLRAFFLNIDSKADGEVSSSPVTQWAVRLPAHFVKCLADLDVVPLVLVAHWCALLPQVRQNWWIEGWVTRTMTEIAGVLPDECRHWLQWPEKVISQMRNGEIRAQQETTNPQAGSSTI